MHHLDFRVKLVGHDPRWRQFLRDPWLDYDAVRDALIPASAYHDTTTVPGAGSAVATAAGGQLAV
ncbi:hypothetical protein KBI5_21910 [Frankia sp. KB5]|nr:hypothetical protein CgIS1_21535 [Frankia sp. CgIS1]ORT47048.1 hypothetical protein KBI5_21910 [Frankia sp. KB5]